VLEYFEDYWTTTGEEISMQLPIFVVTGITHLCCNRNNPNQLRAWPIFLVFIFSEMPLSYQFMIFDLWSDSYPACNSVSLHRKGKRKLPLSLAVPEFSSLPDTHTTPTGCDRGWRNWLGRSIHFYRSVHDHHTFFKWKILAARFKSQKKHSLPDLNPI